MVEQENNIQRDVLAMIEETLTAFQNKEYAVLREVSNHTIHNASIFQDKDSIALAVIVYALYKIMTRMSETKAVITPHINTVLQHLTNAKKALRKNDMAAYRNIIKKVISSVAKADSKMKLYVGEVMKHAEIKKGSGLYEHGISLSQAASVLGISEWELLPYVGRRAVCEYECDPSSVIKRVALARSIFGDHGKKVSA